MQRHRCTRSSSGDIVECDEKEDGSWNMNIAVCCVNESHYVGILQKCMLEAEFVKDVQGLLEGYELKRMAPCTMD